MIFFPDFAPKFSEKSDAFCFFNQICENKLESCRSFWNLWELFSIFQNYSLVSLSTPCTCHGEDRTSPSSMPARRRSSWSQQRWAARGTPSPPRWSAHKTWAWSGYLWSFWLGSSFGRVALATSSFYLGSNSFCRTKTLLQTFNEWFYIIEGF